MSVIDMIESTPEYRGMDRQRQATETPTAGASVQAATGEGAATTAAGDPVAASLGPVLSAEKSDVEFWVNIAQLVILLFILREVSR